MDELERRIRDANPWKDQPLSPRAEQVLDDILSGRRTPHRSLEPTRAKRRSRWTSLGLAGLAAAFVVVVVVSQVVLRPQPVYALTPAPLVVTRADESVAALRARVEARLAAAVPGEASRRGAEWDGWYLHLTQGAPEATAIQSQHTVSTWEPDGSGRSTITAGEPSDADGRPVSVLTQDLVAPGTVLMDYSAGPGEFGLTFPGVPPEDEAGMRAYLDRYLAGIGPAPHPAGDYLAAVDLLLADWTLSEQAELAVLSVLLDAGGVDVAGATTDRAGRPGVLIEVGPYSLSGLYTAYLVIDPQTCHLLDEEHVAVDAIPDYAIPKGAVVDYTIWR